MERMQKMMAMVEADKNKQGHNWSDASGKTDHAQAMLDLADEHVSK